MERRVLTGFLLVLMRQCVRLVEWMARWWYFPVIVVGTAFVSGISL